MALLMLATRHVVGIATPLQRGSDQRVGMQSVRRQQALQCPRCTQRFAILRRTQQRRTRHDPPRIGGGDYRDQAHGRTPCHASAAIVGASAGLI